MKYGIKNTRMIPTSKIYLDQKNPRHEPFNDQETAIEYLCSHEKVYEIAKDIVEIGLNPLELCAVIKDESGAFYAAEGNRRLCAIKLLNDPDRAPKGKRKQFLKISEGWNPIRELFCVEFETREEVSIWLDRIHAGENDGKGRKSWKPEQKARNTNYKTNLIPAELLDLAQKKGLITEEEKKGRLSTVQRYLSNPLMRDSLGLDSLSSENISTDLPSQDFNKVFSRFISDVANKKINTRDNKDKITKYSRKLTKISGLSGKRIKRTEIKTVENNKKNHKIKKPARPEKPQNISANQELEKALNKLGNHKISSLYFSICDLSLDDHTPLLSVGAWSLLESLTSAHGRKQGDPFTHYLSNNKLIKMNLGKTNKEVAAIRDALERISKAGNVTKHDKQAANFNGEQLANDMETITDLLMILSKEIQG